MRKSEIFVPPPNYKARTAGYIRAAALMGILVTFGQTKVTAGRQHYKSAPRYPRLEPYAKVKNRINNSGPIPRSACA